MGRLAPPQDDENDPLVTFTRCGLCTYSPRNWPETYRVCPSCQTAMTQLQGRRSKVMDEATAYSLACHLEFDRRMAEETPEQRSERQARYERLLLQEDLETEQRCAQIKAQFDDLMGGQFDGPQGQIISSLSARLPKAHLD